MFRNDGQRALAYTAHNLLGRMLKEDGELPPGFVMDLSGKQLVITMPPETVVSRSEGIKGDGIEDKTATQKLYGFAIIYALVHHLMRYLRKFRLEAKAERLMLALVRRIVRTALESSVTSEDAFRELHPRLANGIDEIRDKIRARLPKIGYKTQRRVETTGEPTLVFRNNKKVA